MLFAAYFVSFNKLTEVNVQQSFRFSLDVVSKFEGKIKISEINYVPLFLVVSAKTKH